MPLKLFRPSEYRGFNSIFWRLFCGLLFVIVLSWSLTSAALWVIQSEEVALGGLDMRVGGGKAVQTAITVTRYGGRDELIKWLQSPANESPTVYVVDSEGREISGREPPIEALNALDNTAFVDAEDIILKDFPLNAVVHVGIDNQPYTAFAAFRHSPYKIFFLNPSTGRCPQP